MSINSTGIGGMTPEAGAGTAFDGGVPVGDSDGAATTLLTASTTITTPGAHSVYFSIFDQGDRILDSAVFLDNLIVGYTPNPEVDCAPGAEIVTHDLDLEPNTGTAPVDTSHTVTATLTDDAGDPVADTSIEFAVSGAHSTTGSATTDATGQATFSYTGTAAGNDTISGCARPEVGEPCSATDSVSFVWTDEGGPVVERIAGDTRYGTAAALSGDYAPGVNAVFVATGEVYADSMSGAPISVAIGGPIVLTQPGTLPAETITELERLDPQRIIILGGTSSVSAQIQVDLAAYFG